MRRIFTDAQKRSFAWRCSLGLNAINQMEPLHIYKPWGAIFYTLSVQLVRLATLTLVTFNMLIWFFIPVWMMVLYEYFLSLKWMQKYNISSIKILIFTIACEMCFTIISPFIRKCIWFMISGEWL